MAADSVSAQNHRQRWAPMLGLVTTLVVVAAIAIITDRNVAKFPQAAQWLTHGLILLILLPGCYYLLYLFWLGLAHANRQIREQVAKREELSRYNQRLLESTGEGIYGINQSGLCTFMNRAGALILRGEPSDFIGQDMHQLVHHTQTDGSPYPLEMCPIYQSSKLGNGCRLDDEVFWGLDGTSVPVEYSSFPIFNGETLEGVVVTFSDITARLRHQHELQAARDQAEAANLSKSQFLANMSHELRTPLNAVIMYSELLMEDAEDQDAESFIPDLNRIRAAGKHLLELVNGVLDLSKVEAGKMDVFPETIDIPGLTTEMLAILEPMVTKNNNRILTHVDDNAQSMIGDVTKIRQLLFNLLSNAIKFTENGTIELRVSRNAASKSILFSVKDSGIGMTAEQMSRLFQPFMQADSSTTRKYGGTGLGLAIVKRFAELMGGTVEVQSQEKVGTTFTVALPENASELAVATEAPSPQTAMNESSSSGSPDSGNQDSALVLVIDDDPTVRDVLSRVLISEGVRCITAANGHEGLAKAHAHLPELIILDVLMPTIDGWSVLTSLKANPRLSEIPVIIHSVKDDRDLGFMLGASEYMVKPVNRGVLSSLLCKYVNADDAYILVIDDDDATRRLIGRTLKREGWKLTAVSRGEQGLVEVDRQKPVAILLDLMMPEMDGFAFLEALRSRVDWREIPVVVMTSKELTVEDRRRLNGGVKKILEKSSVNRHQFLDEVRRIVKLIHRSKPDGTLRMQLESQ